jgi:hypothetical protein
MKRGCASGPSAVLARAHRPEAVRWGAAVLLPLAFAAHAYETDQLTRRAQPLDDASAAADAEVDRRLAEAAAQTNRLTGCRWKDEPTRRLLAYRIYAATSPNEYVPNRGELSGFGHGSYSAWLETADIPRRTFQDRDDIYGGLTAQESLVLAAVGVCSTVRLGGVLMGTDKPDHFFAEGFEYYLISRFARDERRAVKWGTSTERGTFGLLTSGTFSWADLHANFRGFEFYRALLSATSPLQRAPDGCVAPSRPWHWSEWLDEAADEVLNPSVHTREVAEALRARLAEHRVEICAGYAEWGAGLADRREAVALREAAHVSGKAPPRKDEWGLEALCGAVGGDADPADVP